MSDTQTLEGIKQAAPEGATHYHIGLQLYFRPRSNYWEARRSNGVWTYTATTSKQLEIGLRCGEVIMLSETPIDDMAESMPFELLEGDQDDQRSKYHREIKPGVWVDCYDVLKAFDVRCPALQHMIKKCLAPGQRGHKDLQQDMNDIVASAKRARELAKC